MLSWQQQHLTSGPVLWLLALLLDSAPVLPPGFVSGWTAAPAAEAGMGCGGAGSDLSQRGSQWSGDPRSWETREERRSMIKQGSYSNIIEVIFQQAHSGLPPT